VTSQDKKWLFHFRIGIDKLNHNATGLGHAIRCIRLIEEAKKHDIECFVISSDNKATKDFLSSKNIEFEKESKIAELRGDFDVIVSDINYLDNHVFNSYREIGKKIVSVAPRGHSKYNADIAILDVDFKDVNSKQKNKKSRIFSDMNYTVTDTRFKLIRERIQKGDLEKKENEIVVFMGGVDHNDLTQKVVRCIIKLKKHYNIHVILGELNNNLENILRLKRYENEHCTMQIHINPSNYYEIMAKCKFGFFSAGISSYEAAGLGTVPLNISISNFHKNRSIEMEQKKIGIDLGFIVDFEKTFEAKINDLKVNNLNLFSKNGIKLIDGNGAARIVKKIIENVNV
jgi:spore coat polysaccharide biosynthesis predicted glycosyltransferase SpsG